MTSSLPDRSTIPMEPVRTPDATLADLITVLLDKGTYLNIDAIISVADIPLIGINLRATIAGMETMLEYGMMREWDEKTRAWVRQSIARHFPLTAGEEIVAKMAGGYFEVGDWGSTWRPGGLYLTNKRLVVFRRDPKAVLWQAALEQIRALRLVEEPTIGVELRTRLLVDTVEGTTTKLSAAAPERIRGLIAQHSPHIHLSKASETPPDASVTTHAWYLEPRASGTLWRGGTLTLQTTRLMWRAPIDARAAVNLEVSDLQAVQLVSAKAPSGQGQVLQLKTATADIQLAVAQPQWWYQLLAAQLPSEADCKEEAHAAD